MAQLPAGSEGAAAGVLIWSFFCLSCNIVMLWLLWACMERRSYIFIVSCVTLLATTTSIIEQVVLVLRYEDILWERLRWTKAATDNALLIAADGNSGVGLVMWTIRWGCYIAESGVACFWAFSLAQAVYGWRDDIRFYRPLVVISEAGKVFPILAAIFTMALLQLDALQESYWWFSFVLHFFYCAFLAVANLMFLLIFVEYLQTRRLFRRMNSQQRRDYVQQPAPMHHHHQHHQHHHPGGQHARAGSTATSVITVQVSRVPSASGSHFGALQQRQGGIYDRWLVARASLCVIALTAFEIDNILVNLSHPDAMRRAAALPAPDLAAGTARGTFLAFMPGCLASLIVALAFGTTRSLRDRLRCAFTPRCLQQQQQQQQRPSSSRGGAGPRRRGRRGSAARRYVAMDTDNGILSRQRRLSMEKQLRIEVTYEFEIRNEQVAAPVLQLRGDGAPGPRGGSKAGAASACQYSVESHRWDDTERILPKKPSISVMRGQG